MRVVLFAAIVGVTAAAAILACSSATDDGATIPDGDGGAPDVVAVDVLDAAPPPPYPLNQVCPPPENDGSLSTCALCNRGKCCQTRAAFDNDAGSALIDCVSAGSSADDAGAMRSCLEQYPDKAQAYLDQFTCLSYACQKECSDPDAAADPCQECTNANCLYDSLACDENPDCFVFSTCYVSCGATPTCLSSCYATFPQAQALVEKLGACANRYCPAVCAGGG